MKTEFEEIRYLTGRVRCMVCGVEFKREEKHPVSIRFVNGYPDVCEQVGKIPIDFINLDDGSVVSWRMTVFDDKIIKIVSNIRSNRSNSMSRRCQEK